MASMELLPAASLLTHNSQLGTRRPDVAVVNCFGEIYLYVQFVEATEDQ